MYLCIVAIFHTVPPALVPGASASPGYDLWILAGRGAGPRIGEPWPFGSRLASASVAIARFGCRSHRR
jgi:hypothetical protein